MYSLQIANVLPRIGELSDSINTMRRSPNERNNFIKKVTITTLIIVENDNNEQTRGEFYIRSGAEDASLLQYDNAKQVAVLCCYFRSKMGDECSDFSLSSNQARR